MIAWLLLLVSLVGLVVFRYRRRRLYQLAAAIPASEDALPVIGNAHKFVGSTETIMSTLQHYSYDSMRNDGILRLWLGHILYFVEVNPVDLEVVLKTCLEKDDLHRFIRKINGYGGIFAPVSIWRRRRKIMVPAFSPKIVDSFVRVFSGQSERLATHLMERAGAGKYPLWPFLSTYTLDSVCAWLLLLVSLVGLVVFRYRRRRLYQLAAAIPASEDALPVIGNAHKFVGSTETIMSTLQHYSYDSMRNDGILRLWLGHILYFVEVNPVDLEVVLKTCLEKDDLHRFIRKINGYGGIFAPVSIWRRRRKIMVPAFSPKIVDSFVRVFSGQSERLATHLMERAGAGKFPLWPFLSTYTLDSVCETTMGVKINAQGNPDSPFLNAMSRILNLVCERIFHLWLQPDWLYKLFPQYKQHQKELTVMHGFTDEIIKKKREEIKLENQTRTEAVIEYGLGMYTNQTFLDLLITNSGGEKGYTNIELREEILTLIIAGTDTSAVAIGYTLKLLAKYPQIQEKLYQELYEVFGNSDRPMVKEDLMNMKYLERVIKETLRLYPPVPFVIRKVLEEITLPSGRTLPAGSGVVVSIWGAHRDPKYWGPDAEHFDPDRFLPERFKLVNPCSFMPFSHGPRNCLGYQYALMSIKAALSAVLRRYRVVNDIENSPTPHIRVKLDIMMKAVDGYEISLERRTNAVPA